MPVYFLLMAAAAAIAVKKLRGGKTGPKQRREEFRGDTGINWAVYTDNNIDPTGFKDFVLHVFVIENGREEPVLVYALSTNGRTRLISTDKNASETIVKMALSDLRITKE